MKINSDLNCFSLNLNTLKPFSLWEAPTTKEVDFIWNIVCHKYNLPVSVLHQILGVGERAARRWRSISNSKKGKSTIKYTNWCMLISLLSNNVLFKKSRFKIYTNNLLMCVDEYNSLNSLQVKSIIEVTQLKGKEISNFLGLKTSIGYRNKISFHAYFCLITYLNIEPALLLKFKFTNISNCHYLLKDYSNDQLESSYLILCEILKFKPKDSKFYRKRANI